MSRNWNSNIKTLSDEDFIKQLHIVAKMFNKYINTKMLFIANDGRDNPLVYYEVAIKAERFMHLTGCTTKIVEPRLLYAKGFFKKCLDKTIKREDFDFLHNKNIATGKLMALQQSLQYEYAKLFEIGDKTTSTQNNEFHFAVGNSNAIVAYTYVDNSGQAIPTSAMSEPLDKYVAKSFKMVCILIKSINDKLYCNIHSSITNKLKEILNRSDIACPELLSKLDMNELFKK